MMDNMAGVRVNIRKIMTSLLVSGIVAVLLPFSSNALSGNPLSAAGFLDFKEKNAAPDFILKDLEDNPIQLYAFQGKVVLLYFWTTWWVWCRKEVSSLIKLYDEFKNEGFVVIGIDVQEGKEIVKKYVDKYKLTFPVLLDIQGKVEKKYGVRGHPDHFLINRRGELIGKTLGPRNWAKPNNRDLIRFFLDQDWRLQKVMYFLWL